MKMKHLSAVDSLMVLFLGLLTLCSALEINECVNRFTCRDGRCGSTGLAEADRCNSIINCLDGSDEANCDVCPDGFYCDSGNQCVNSVSSRCDGRRDCNDGSDEENCGRNLPLSKPAIIGIAVTAFVVVILLPAILCAVVCGCVLCSMVKTTPTSDSKKSPLYNNSDKEPEPKASYALTEIPRQEMEANSHPTYKYPSSGPSSISYCVDGVPLHEIEAYSPPPQAYDPPLDSNTRFGH